jgi:hypothetical protein
MGRCNKDEVGAYMGELYNSLSRAARWSVTILGVMLQRRQVTR